MSATLVLNLNGAARLAGLNCLGRGCDERNECRRFRVMVNAPQATKERPFGMWASFDVEARRLGDCVQFVEYQPA